MCSSNGTRDRPEAENKSGDVALELMEALKHINHTSTVQENPPSPMGWIYLVGSTRL